ncbi:uncharacterized protein CTHT_0005800 [Thermochaetoides thermophila DSM 1495]|uniref:Major facilitator superfamily (MFS) profile domain-containing protein n=1 Tax=Chaetomium thermophilum (strain DSM 1495 / CBS 144.50 / IMI 039719) TaxID=759272 RepID=G0RY86_CHATD|nr:hypothetical protein CTHT_0005800 [Thermochaetoides thermophila DSM 1495]EGS23872.1 hypothetical protein CTHT_0005800 [Thermochaetoides thermophila DSM 1495]
MAGSPGPIQSDGHHEKKNLDKAIVSDATATATCTDEESGTPPTPSQSALQRWNESKENMFRFFCTLYCFIRMGMTDGAIGALLPYIETHYSISYTLVSLVFFVPFIGYLLAALSNHRIHHHFGQRGIAILAPLCRLASFIPLAFHPPYPAVPIILLLSGYGNGLEDSAWNAWIGNMQRANELLGFLHGAYGLGATIGPLAATAMRRTTRLALTNPITWTIAIFLLAYVGAEVSLGGWITTFMLRARSAPPFLAGLTATLFWLGLTLGRVVLGFVTGRMGEKPAITLYLLLCVAFELGYWLVPHFAAAAVFVTSLGFFLGPLFPAAIVAAAKLLPSELHVSAIGFAAAFGGGGAAVFPFAVGAIAQKKGVEVLQPVVLGVLVFILGVWVMLPGGFRKGGLERARERGEGVGGDWVRAWREMKSLGGLSGK